MRRALILTSSTLVLCIAAGLPATVLAQTAAISPPDSTVVVTATRTPTPKAEIADSITVVTAEDIATKQLQTLPDLLNTVPGLNIVQTGGPGGQTSIFMRGTNSNHTKVLVDGIDVSDPSSANASFDLGQFLTPDVARVEVLRGPQSGLYGSDAIGGVINIITKSGNGPAQFTAGLEGGSFETFNQTAGVSGGTGPFHYTANVEHFRAGATPVTPLNLLPAGRKRIDDYNDNFTLSSKLGYDITSQFDVGLVARYTNTHLRFTGTDYSTFPAFPAAKQSDSDTLQYYTRGLAHLVLMDGRLDQTVGIAYSSDKTTAVAPGNFHSYNAGDRLKLDWQANLKLAKGETLVVGAEHQRDEINLPISAHTTINAVYGELQSNLFPNLYDTISIRYDDNDRFGGKATYRVAPTYLIAATGTKLVASLGTGFKAPTLGQMYQSYPAFGFFANPNLKPETSTGYDFGFEQSLVETRLQFGATYFHNHITNLISNNASFTSYANIGRAHTEGVESFIAFKPLRSVTLRADYTYTKAFDDVAHLELLRRPRSKWNLDARWQATSKLSFNADLVAVSAFVDGNRDFSISRLRAPGYTTVDLAGNYDFSRMFSVYARITNLFDETYQNPTGFLHPGRGVYVGVKAKL